MSDLSGQFAERIRAAAGPFCLRGGGTKDFYGNPLRGEVFDLAGHRGILAYEPTELVITARCGTPLTEIEAALAEKGQYLPFEPPAFGAGGTLGGMVAAGLSGPRRASAGSVRDYVLGVKLLDGQGRELSFGGQVMKNVAGYDVSRLVAGSLGTLGVILDVSLKVLPRPAADHTLALEMDEATALATLNRWAGQPLPIVASSWHGGRLHVRLAGARAAVEAARQKLGGDGTVATGFWDDLRNQRLPFFAGESPLWRLSLPSTTPALALGETLVEWGGAQRWLRGGEATERLRDAAARAGGHATLFRGSDALKASIGGFAPVPAPLRVLNRRIKAAFDPRGLFNPGRLGEES